jgi:hypothetical protein
MKRHGIVARAGTKVRRTIERVFTAAFLDPGRPASRWLGAFTGEARKLAWARRDVLTIGPLRPAARSLRQTHGRLRVRVLLNRRGHPLTAYATVGFGAVGRVAAGRKLAVVSVGRFFLRPGSHGWVIYAFDVKREDRRKRR